MYENVIMKPIGVYNNLKKMNLKNWKRAKQKNKLVESTSGLERERK